MCWASRCARWWMSSKAAGSYRIQWDARDQQGAALSSGIYITRLSYPGGVQTRRLLYLK